jgi:hypothetical protein
MPNKPKVNDPRKVGRVISPLQIKLLLLFRKRFREQPTFSDLAHRPDTPVSHPQHH